MATTLILSLVHFLTERPLTGSFLVGISFFLAIIVYFRKKLQKIIPFLAFVLDHVILNIGLIHAKSSISEMTPISAFYTGYTFALVYSVTSHFFPRFRNKLLFLSASIAGRYIIMEPDGYNNVIGVIILDIFLILYFYLSERNTRSLFKIFHDYREDFAKFKTLFAYHLPQHIVILSNDLEKKFFVNNSFKTHFKAQSLSQIKSILSQLVINMETFDKNDFADYQFDPPIETTANLSLIDFFTQYKDSINTNSNIACFNVQNVQQETNDSDEAPCNYSAKAFHLKWDDSDSLVIMLDDLTQQETILALKIADENKDKVLATVSHELRTPINGILGVVQLIESEFQDPHLISFIKTAKVCSTLLLNLVNSILDLTQIRKNCIKLNPTLFKLSLMLEEIESIFKPQCISKNLQFKINVDETIPESIISDRNRITQIIINLLANALKFTFKGKITVSIFSTDRDDEIRVKIEDTGIGIKEEDQPKLFKMFGKVEATSKINTQGVGLGLTISQNLVVLLNPHKTDAKIDFSSVYKEGTTFSFTLYTKFKDDDQDSQVEIPISHFKSEDLNLNQSIDSAWYNELMSENYSPRESTDTKKQINLAYQPPRSLFQSISPTNIRRNNQDDNVKKSISGVVTTVQSVCFDDPPPGPEIFKEKMSIYVTPVQEQISVLVVDDNTFNILVLSNFLKKNGFKVVSAFNGEEAIEKVKEQDRFSFFRLIFMDCQMPVMDGYETSQRLIEMMNKGNIIKTPIIALTADICEESIQKCYQSGMVEHLMKPTSKDCLKTALSKFY